MPQFEPQWPFQSQQRSEPPWVVIAGLEQTTGTLESKLDIKPPVPSGLQTAPGFENIMTAPPPIVGTDYSTAVAAAAVPLDGAEKAGSMQGVLAG